MKRKIRWLLSLVLITLIVLDLAVVVAATDSNAEAEVSAQTEHTHNWQRTSADDQFHTVVCSGCNTSQTLTHSFSAAGVCSDCGYTYHEHIWQYTQGENYDDSHGMHCTQCSAISEEDHVYGGDGKCVVCGNSPPHEHQWKWDGNKSNYLWDHFVVCSCGATTTERHNFFAWDGLAGDNYGHRELCGVCGFAWILEHRYDPAYFNGKYCVVCNYPGPATTVPTVRPNETTPGETGPAGSEPNETAPAETRPAGGEPNETAPAETKPAGSDQNETSSVETEIAETQAKEMECVESEPTQSESPSSETTSQNSEKKDSRHSSSIWVTGAVILAAVGGLGAVVLFLKRNPTKKK